MMNKKILFIPVLIFAALCIFAQEDYEDTMILNSPEETEEQWWEQPEEYSGEQPVWQTEAQPEEPPAEQPVIPQSILNNQYFIRSVQLNELAKDAFEEGDYDASAAYAEEAAEYARLSDEYVAMRLADSIFTRAHNRYAWAGSVGASTRYPAQYRTATTAYNEAVQAHQAENWDTVSNASSRVIAALADVKGPGGETGPVTGSQPPRPAQGTLPAQYTVRRWSDTGDCFSAIAGWSWVYGDPYQWRKLYEANKHKLPNPDNPHLILPGMVLDIPSLRGEVRSGMWDPEAK
ncbi:MAG: LysM peptidoglycan-binding domain-containing protein [Treponema sp.]|jgi:hypothetical protein|nr:LysM peptidoglycan-binding domain-containing protein [Treponema sp.]